MPSAPVKHGSFIFVPLVVGPEVFRQTLAGIAISGEGGEVDVVILSEVIGALGITMNVSCVVLPKSGTVRFRVDFL